MIFKTKREKYAYVLGIKKGNRGGKPYSRKSRYRKRKKNYSYGYKGSPRSGAYNSRGRINENLVDDRHGPVVFFAGNDFDYNSIGRIKGFYTSDGFF